MRRVDRQTEFYTPENRPIPRLIIERCVLFGLRDRPLRLNSQPSFLQIDTALIVMESDETPAPPHLRRFVHVQRNLIETRLQRFHMKLTQKPRPHPRQFHGIVKRVYQSHSPPFRPKPWRSNGPSWTVPSACMLRERPTRNLWRVHTDFAGE